MNGGSAGDQLAVVSGDGGRSGGGALVLTGFNLESELAVQDIDEARRKLRWLHDHVRRSGSAIFLSVSVSVCLLFIVSTFTGSVAFQVLICA